MLRKHAASEFRTIRDIRQRVQSIPRANEFFLLEGAHLCLPAKLTRDDLAGFGKKCKSLTKRGFTAQNINDKEWLEQLGAINEPFGGIDVYDYMRSDVVKTQPREVAFDPLVSALLRLLVDGVAPMNRRGVFHCDIKNSNVLVQTVPTSATGTKMLARLIDWGLSVVLPSSSSSPTTQSPRQSGGTGRKGKSAAAAAANNSTAKHNGMEQWNTSPPTLVPYNLYYRPFQYNVPFSVVLFNNAFAKEYDVFWNEKMRTAAAGATEISDFELYEFVLNYVFAWNQKRGAGHLSTIHSIFTKLSMDDLPDVQRRLVKQHVVEYDFTYHYIVEYIVAVLKKYGKRRSGSGGAATDRLGEYLYTVFLPNVDVWGTIMVFMSLYEAMLVTPIAGIDPEALKAVLVQLLFDDPTRVLTPAHVAEQLRRVFDHAAGTDAKEPASPAPPPSL